MARIYAPKTPSVEPFGDIDVGQYLPLLDTYEMQRLAWVEQLGFAGHIFSSARHTRYAHVLGVMEIARMYMRELFRRGFFEGEDHGQLERDVCVTALAHDLGTPPKGHTAEWVLAYAGKSKVDHKDITRRIVRRLSEPIQKCGANPETVLRYLDKSIVSPGNFVTLKTIGADKVGYLILDSYLAERGTVEMRDARRLMLYLAFEESGVVVEEKGVSVLEKLQKAYLKVYKEIYYRKAALGVERLFQKGLEALIEVGGVNPGAVWELEDHDVMSMLKHATSESAQEMYQRLRGRRLLKSAVVAKVDRFTHMQRIAGKPRTVIGSSVEQITDFTKAYRNPWKRSQLEGMIAHILGLRQMEVAVTCVPQLEKMIPQDIALVDHIGNSRGTLFEYCPDLEGELNKTAQGFFEIHVMVPKKHQEHVSKRPEALKEAVLAHSRIEL